MKSHVIAKIILTILLSLSFSYILICIKDIDKQQSTQTTKTELIHGHSIVDKGLNNLSISLTNYARNHTITNIIVVSTIFSFVLVMIIDSICGVGRSYNIFSREKE